VAFAAVVVLTMFAAASFDPRLMWDAATAAGHDVSPAGYELPHAAELAEVNLRSGDPEGLASPA
jgi:hypothetical protein